jgi:nitroreductase
MSDWARTGVKKPDFAAPAAYLGAYRRRRRDCALQLYESVGIRRGDRAASGSQSMQNFQFFGAPHVAVITSPAEFGVYGALDAGIFLGNLLLAAQAFGLGAVPQAAIAAYSRQLRTHLEIPDDRRVLGAVSFGYPNEDEPINGYRTPRAELDEAVTWMEA